MEIERKFTIKTLPQNLSDYPCLHLEQGYLCTHPVVRVRKQDDSYILTVKGSGMLARQEEEFALSKESYLHLKAKCDGTIISKKRYKIPLVSPQFQPDFPSERIPNQLCIELDIFDAPFAPLVIAEVEFHSIEEANAFIAPDWFLEDVTHDPAYHNSHLSRKMDKSISK